MMQNLSFPTVPQTSCLNISAPKLLVQMTLSMEFELTGFFNLINLFENTN